MLIGIDLDNTIAIYDEAIRELPDGSNFTCKQDYSNFLINNGKNDLWTELQGSLYGPLMKYASIAKNFKLAVRYFAIKNYEITIISHRTKYPYKGKKYNLHVYANKWIEDNLIELFEIYKIRYSIYLCETKNEKIIKIKENNCNYFIDDLQSIYDDSNFPRQKTKFILYSNKKNELVKNMENWEEIKEIINE